MERCYHCGESCNSAENQSGEFDGQMRYFCCGGCLFACQLIHDAGEASYYKNRTAFPSSEIVKNKFLQKKEIEKTDAFDFPDIAEKYIKHLPDMKSRIALSIEGIHCSSCVFINERILSWTDGVIHAVVNYETGRATVDYDPEIIKISEIIRVIQSIGYNAKPVKPGQLSDNLFREGRALLRRLVVAGFFAGNTMMMALATWIGFFDASMRSEYFYFFHWMQFILSTPVFIYSADTFHRGWKSFLKVGIPGMDLLISTGISVAYFYSIYATLYRTGVVYFDTVTTIVFFLLTGRYLEWKARYEQRLKMESLVQPPPEYCFRLEKSGQRIQIPVEKLNRHDVISASSGDILPTDGIVTGGDCEMDESVLTGESKSVIRKIGDRILAGSRVLSGELIYSADTLTEESSLSVLSDLARTSGNEQSHVEKFTLRIVPWFTAIILTVAGSSFIYHYYFADSNLATSLLSVISVLIISCPCALALSVPTAVGSGIYAGLKKGILIRDGAVIENLVKIKKYFFDKTGTLTIGAPSVVDFMILYDENEVIEMIFKLEHGSSHPTGRALYSHMRIIYPDILSLYEPSEDDIVQIPGRGLKYNDNGREYRLGSESFVNETLVGENDDQIKNYLLKNREHSNILFSENGRVKAVFSLRDELRPTSLKTIKELSLNKEIFILTGDSRSAAMTVADELAIDHDRVFHDLLPDEKKVLIDQISNREHICMVGDGYNDSVALSHADVSIVLARGAPLSLEYAKIILLKNDLMDILVAEKISKRTVMTIRINLAFSLFYNLIAIPFAAAGLLLPVWCAIFMSVSSLTVVGSSIILRWRNA